MALAAPFRAHRAEFESQGWCVLRGFMPPPELAQRRANIEAYIGALARSEIKADGRHAKFAEDGDRSRPQLLVNMVEMELLSPGQMDRWMAVGSALLGEDCRVMTNEFTGSRVQYFDKPPGSSSPTPPHQDQFYFNVLPARALTLWLALDPVDRSNSCLQYVTGSHKGWATRPHMSTNLTGMSAAVAWTADDERNAEDIILAPGDLCCHHVCTVHRAAANNNNTSAVDGRHRRAFSLVLQGKTTGRDEVAYRSYRDSVERQKAGISGGAAHKL